MKFVIKSLPVLAVIFLFVSSVFAESVLRVKPSLSQPEETDSNGGEISPFIKMNMEVSPKSNKTVIIRNMIAKIDNISEVSSSVNRVAVILNKSPGVDDLEVGRVVANAFNNGDGSFYLYPIHGDAIFNLKKKTKMTAAVIMNKNIGEEQSGKKISILITNIFGSWANGSQVSVGGYLPIISEIKTINSSPNLGVINEDEAPYGSLKYSVPGDSSEGVRIKKIFIYGKRKDLKILVQTEGEENKTFECKNNSYITSCDFGNKGMIIPKGSSVMITASEPGIFYPGFNTLDVFCEGEDSGRRIFVNPLYFGGKG